METNLFKQMLAVDVSKHIEKKGQFSYLSWPFAVSQLRLADPAATWEVRRFNGLPYMLTDLGYFVEVAVTVQGITLSQIHPVLDSKNRPISLPSTFEINTSIQRCLVKAIALHGLGLNVYAGEDLPLEGDGDPCEPRPVPNPRPVGMPPAAPPPDDRGAPWSDEEGFPPVVPTEKMITPAQIGFVRKLIAETGTNEDQLLDYFGFFNLESIPRAEVSRVITALQNRRRAA